MPAKFWALWIFQKDYSYIQVFVCALLNSRISRALENVQTDDAKLIESLQWP